MNDDAGRIDHAPERRRRHAREAFNCSPFDRGDDNVARTRLRRSLPDGRRFRTQRLDDSGATVGRLESEQRRALAELFDGRD